MKKILIIALVLGLVGGLSAYALAEVYGPARMYRAQMGGGWGYGMGGMMGGMMGWGGPPYTQINPEQDFLSGINSSLWISGLIAAGVALLLGLLLTRQITRPVRALTRAARNVAKGRFDSRVNVKSKDELGCS